MGTVDQDIKILKNYIDKLIIELEKGEYVLVSGGYIYNDYKKTLIDTNCSRIVSKLTSLGYEYTSNHGHNCLDYKFSKAIKL